MWVLSLSGGPESSVLRHGFDRLELREFAIAAKNDDRQVLG